MTGWTNLVPTVLSLERHERLRVDADGIRHPREDGFYRSTGLARARAHYRLPLADGRGIHVHAHNGHYDVHWDRWDPRVSLVRHILSDVGHAGLKKVRGLARRWRRAAARSADPSGTAPA